MASAQTQWIHWKKYIPEFNTSKPAKIQTTSNVSANDASLNYGFKLDLSLENKKKPSGFVRLKLVWDIMGINESLDVRVQELKLQNCSIKLFMRSLEGEEKFLKWLHLDATGNKKSISWKTFIPKMKYWLLTMNKENKNRPFSCEVTFFGRLCIKLPMENLIIATDEGLFGAGSTLSIPCEVSSCDSEATKVILTTEVPEEHVVVNKFHLAAYSPVFRKMFFGVNMKERVMLGSIKVPGAPFLVLKTFVSLIGGLKPVGKEVLEMAPANILAVLCVARKFDVEGVVDICKMILMAVPDCNMAMVHAFNLYHVGKAYNIPEFCTRCFEWIERKGVDAVKSEGILTSLKEDIVKEFLTEYCYYLMH